jgi:hypothetical protein
MAREMYTYVGVLKAIYLVRPIEKMIRIQK